MVAVKLHLRSTQLEYKRQFPDIGCRQLKYLYDVYNWTPAINGDVVVALTRVSKKCRITNVNKKFLSSLLRNLNHPNIDIPLTVDMLPDSSAAVITRKVYRRGSLRDELYNSMYSDPFKTKYYKTSARPLKIESIASVGKQILEALSYLESNGIPYTHLSTGNIMMTSSGVARLTETENAFLVIERFYEHIFREFAQNYQAAFLLADINVLAFGCVLYEMSTAMPIHTLSDLDNMALGLPELSEIIRRIFHADGRDSVVPTVSELLQDPFFANAKIPKGARLDSADSSTSTGSLLTNYKESEKEIVKEALKANGKIIYPDDQHLYMATVTNTSNTTAGMGGFIISPPNRTTTKPKRKSNRHPDTSSPIVSPSSSSSYMTNRTPSSSSSRPTSPPPPKAPAPPASSVPPGVPAPPPPPPPSSSSNGTSKSALLSSITSFKSGSLKKTVTVDKSAPKF